MRGKDGRGTVMEGTRGITPARAGKSPGLSRVQIEHRDHPRACGEKFSRSGLIEQLEGSPPRVRGKGRYLQKWPRRPGITPARAGKRHRPRVGTFFARDHPRVCGEKDVSAFAVVVAAGSPPRVRGKVIAHLSYPSFSGITPACAGKSLFEARLSKERRDHPRVCGEKNSSG